MTTETKHGIRVANLANDELEHMIHDLIGTMFRTHKRGYSWLVPKFGKDWRDDIPKMERIMMCLSSKKSQFPCMVHKRLHAAPKL